MRVLCCFSKKFPKDKKNPRKKNKQKKNKQERKPQESKRKQIIL